MRRLLLGTLIAASLLTPAAIALTTARRRGQLGQPSVRTRVRRIGRDFPREVIHGTTRASARAFIEGRDLPERDRQKTLSEFGSNVVYVAEKTAPHQAVMFGTQHGRTMIEMTLAEGREVLDLAPEIQRRPFIGEKGPLAFKGRPSFTDDMGRWLDEKRAARGLKPLPDAVERVDPTSSRFSAQEYPTLLADYVRDRGYAGMRFTDETVLVDRSVIQRARKLTKAEIEALKRVERRMPADRFASLYTRDFEPPDLAGAHGRRRR